MMNTIMKTLPLQSFLAAFTFIYTFRMSDILIFFHFFVGVLTFLVSRTFKVANLHHGEIHVVHIHVGQLVAKESGCLLLRVGTLAGKQVGITLCEINLLHAVELCVIGCTEVDEHEFVFCLCGSLRRAECEVADKMLFSLLALLLSVLLLPIPVFETSPNTYRQPSCLK